MFCPTLITDIEIYKGFKEKRREIFQWFYYEYKPRVAILIKKLGGSEQEAEDVFQDALIATYVNIRHNRFVLRDNVRFSSYFLQVCKFRYLESIRSAKRRYTRCIDTADILFEGDMDFEHENEIIEMSHRLHLFVEHLDGKCIQILNSYYWQRKSLIAISEELDMTPESVRNAKYRCIQKLKKLLRFVKLS
jgi:RNA polymerase sigma factor (sigma-70 family)